jgi:hypothetical protein
MNSYDSMIDVLGDVSLVLGLLMRVIAYLGRQKKIDEVSSEER